MTPELIPGKLYNISANAIILKKDVNKQFYEFTKMYLVLENSIEVIFLKEEPISILPSNSKIIEQINVMSFLYGKETIFLSKDLCDLFLC